MSAPVTPLKWSPVKKQQQQNLKSPGGGASSSGAANGRSPNGNGKGKMRAVFCDVVVEDVYRSDQGWELPPGSSALARFVDSGGVDGG